MSTPRMTKFGDIEVTGEVQVIPFDDGKAIIQVRGNADAQWGHCFIDRQRLRRLAKYLLRIANQPSPTKRKGSK